MTGPTRRARRVVGLVALVLVLAGCGGGGGVGEVSLVAVDPALAPARIEGGLALFEAAEDETEAAFNNAGDKVLQADARLWEVRDGATLVGVLQISTLKPKVDLYDPARRDLIVGEILVGAYDRIRVEGVEVFASGANDKVLYVWFGEGMFEVLQLKGGDLDHERVLADILLHQREIPSWSSLALDEEAEES